MSGDASLLADLLLPPLPATMAALGSWSMVGLQPGGGAGLDCCTTGHRYTGTDGFTGTQEEQVSLEPRPPDPPGWRLGAD